MGMHELVTWRYERSVEDAVATRSGSFGLRIRWRIFWQLAQGPGFKIGVPAISSGLPRVRCVSPVHPRMLEGPIYMQGFEICTRRWERSAEEAVTAAKSQVRHVAAIESEG